MVAVLLALLPPLLVGSLAVWSCWPRVGPAAWRAVLAGALGIGLALGATSWTYFAWVVCAGPSRPGFLLVETLFFALLAAALVVAVRRFPAPDGGDLPRPPHTRWTWAIWAAFGLVLLAALATLGLALARTPHGEIDAWQIWNLHARLLTRGGDEWREPFARLSALYHPDYPLLVPAAVARGWTCAGEESTLVPRLVAFLFAAATVGLLVAGLTLLRTPAQGCLAGLVLLATPPYLRYTAAQYGDVPLGLYFLAGVLLFEVRDRLRSGSERLPVLAGVVAGMAAWTKNEGQLFVIATLLARLVVAWAGGRASRPAPRALVAFAAGLLPFAAALAYFKLGVAPTNDLVAGQEGGATLPRLLDGERLWEVVSGMVEALVTVVGGAVLVLALYAALLGRARGDGGRGLHTLTVLAILLAGYALVYLTTPLPLSLHIFLSADRLWLQLWPCALLLFFLNVAAPEERLAADPAGPRR
ncbi:MAG TPA: glycosyltransferase family 39 protein [Gemmataceae bacterium]|nr:glycosyltransferase family 39 protein [Gemmataceae bacterium]